MHADIARPEPTGKTDRWSLVNPVPVSGIDVNICGRGGGTFAARGRAILEIA